MELLVASVRKRGRPASIKRDCLTDSLADSKPAKLKRELGVYFIERGFYKLTDTGIAKLGDGRTRQFEDPAVHSVCRQIGETQTVCSKPSKTEMLSSAKQAAWKLIGEGKAQELYDLGYATPRADWSEAKTRIAATRMLAAVLEKKTCRLNADDFTKNGLASLLCGRYNGSPFRALLEEGSMHSVEIALEHSRTGKFENSDKIYPWETSQVTSGLFSNKDVRVAACRWLVWKTGKEPKRLKFDDFCSNSLAGLLQKYYKSSPFAALVEAGYAYSLTETKNHIRTGQFGSERIYPWEVNMVSRGFFNDRELRIGATKWLLWKTGKKPKDLAVEDFEANGLGGLLCNHYGNSPFAALVEARFAFSLKETYAHAREGNFRTDKIYPWEMAQTPSGFLDKKKFRVSATKWLLWKTGNEPQELKAEDFNSNGLSGLLTVHYGNSPFRALIEAGYGYSEQEVLEQYRAGLFKNEKIYPWGMPQVMHGFFEKRETRVAAIRWLIWKTGKSAENIQADDFRSNGLGGLLMGHYGNSPVQAMREALGS